MEYIIVIIVCIFSLLFAKIALNIKIKSLKEIKRIGSSQELNNITNNLPSNKEVCEGILENLGNKNIVIEENEGKENSKVSYYIVIGNKIIIANIKDTFTRIQTIAHECIHSVQDRKILLSNFIFSNIYLIYYFLLLALTIFRVIKPNMYQVAILFTFGLIYYMVRSYLETDAMTKARYVAKEYMMKSGKLSQDNIDKVIENYDVMNKVGIPMSNFMLFMPIIIRIAIYSGISAIITFL